MYKVIMFGPCGYCGKYASDCQFCKHGDNVSGVLK